MTPLFLGGSVETDDYLWLSDDENVRRLVQYGYSSEEEESFPTEGPLPTSVPAFIGASSTFLKTASAPAVSAAAFLADEKADAEKKAVAEKKAAVAKKIEADEKKAAEEKDAAEDEGPSVGTDGSWHHYV